MDEAAQVKAVIAHVRTHLGDLSLIQPPRGYDSIALALLDAIWSIGVRYTAVENVLEAYRGWVRERGGNPEERTIKQMLIDLRDIGGPESFAELTNRQRTSTRNGILKADAVGRAAEVLGEFRINVSADLHHTDLVTVKGRWLAIPGQRSGLSWRYFLMNNRIEDVKADRMITRFVAGALDNGSRAVTPDVAASWLRAAHLTLQTQHPGLTLRALDHAVWRYQSNRDSLL